MTTHTIEIEGLPEGYELTDRPVEINRMLGENTDNGTMQVSATIFLQKSKPRRIVLEETEEIRQVRKGEYFFDPRLSRVAMWMGVQVDISGHEYKIWRIKEE